MSSVERGFFPPEVVVPSSEPEESGYNHMAGIRFAEGQAVLREHIRGSGVQSKEVQDQAKQILDQLYNDSIRTIIEYFEKETPPLYAQFKDRFDTLPDNEGIKVSLVDRAVGILQQQTQLERDSDETMTQILNNWKKKLPDLFAQQQKKENLERGYRKAA